MIPLIPVNKRTMSMSENKTTSETSDHHETDVELENMNDLPEPQEKKKSVEASTNLDYSTYCAADCAFFGGESITF